MANIKSAKKRARQMESKRLKNVARKTAIKTAVKKVLTALEKGDSKDSVTVLMKDVESKISRAKNKNVLHSATAARKVSRLAQRVSKTFRVATA